MLGLVFERPVSQGSSGRMDCLAKHEDWRRQGKSVSNSFAHAYFSAARCSIILCVGSLVILSTSTCLMLEAGRKQSYVVEILVIADRTDFPKE